jgi:hypothetical protein
MAIGLTAPWVVLALVFIPCYFVPLFTMLHLTALFQAHRNARAAQTSPIDAGAAP